MQKLQIINVSKEYDDGENKNIILSNINLTFDSCGLIGIIGECGCGKSTLINLIGGIDNPSQGKVLLNGKNPINHCSFIFQNLNLLEKMTIKEHFKLLGVDEKLLNKWNLENKLDLYPNELSRGQKQRVAVLLATNDERNIIIADEPTSALDIDSATMVMKELIRVSKSKLVIVVSHNTKLIDEYADCIYKIENKKIKIVKPKINKKKIAFTIKERKITIFNKIKYILKSIRFDLVKNIIILVIIYLSIIGPFICQNIKLSILKSVELEKTNSPTTNKFYLQICQKNKKGSLIMSDCKNPIDNQIEKLKEDLIVNENVDYMLNLLFNNMDIQTYKKNLILTSGRLPMSFYEIIADDRFIIGEEIELKAEYLFSIGLLKDIINEKITFKIVGNIKKPLFKKEQIFYFDYDFTKEYFKNKKLINISLSHGKETFVFDYLNTYNSKNHNYVFFVNDISQLNNIMLKNDLTFEEQNKIQLISNSYNYYEVVIDLVNKSKKVLDMTFFFNVVSMLFFFSFIVSLSITKRSKEIGVLRVMNFSKKTVNNLLIIENLFLTLISVSFVLTTYFVLTIFVNNFFKHRVINFSYTSLVFLFLGAFLLDITITYIYIYKLNKVKIIDILREEI